MFRMFCDGHEFNPFLAVNQLMTKKLSREAWGEQCQKFGLSQLVLLPSSASDYNPEPSAQAELFS